MKCVTSTDHKGRAVSSGPPVPGRPRRRRVSWLIGLMLLGALCAEAWRCGRTVVERVTISFPRLPAEFDGTTIALVSDLHSGFLRGGAGAVRKVVETVNSLRADHIVLLGDLVHNPRNAPRYLPMLAKLRAREGLWACLGNHEHRFMWYSRLVGAPRAPSPTGWGGKYAEAGIALLNNEARPLRKRGARIWLVGVDDAYSRADDLEAALRGTERREFRLVITHSPDALDDRRASEVDLVLAGHTHGGQIWLPLVGPLYAPCHRPRERAAGLVRTSGSTMYVTRGAGEGLPIRLGCPREVTLVTLRSG